MSSLQALVLSDLRLLDNVVLTDVMIESYNAWVEPKRRLRSALVGADIDVSDLDAQMEVMGVTLQGHEIDQELVKGDVGEAFEHTREAVAAVVGFVGMLRTLLEVPVGRGLSGATRLQRVTELRRLHDDSPWRDAQVVIAGVKRELTALGDTLSKFGITPAMAVKAEELHRAVHGTRRERLTVEMDRNDATTLVGTDADLARTLLLELDALARGAQLKNGVVVQRPWLAIVNRQVGTKEAAAEARRAAAAELATPPAPHDAAPARADAALDALLDEADAPAATSARKPGVA
jgi:hypothetical protein